MNEEYLREGGGRACMNIENIREEVCEEEEWRLLPRPPKEKF